jgi:hypothetical protein
LRQERQRRAGGRKGPKPGTTLKPIKHGSHAGAQAHRRRGERPCQSCREAHAFHVKVGKAAKRERAA